VASPTAPPKPWESASSCSSETFVTTDTSPTVFGKNNIPTLIQPSPSSVASTMVPQLA